MGEDDLNMEEPPAYTPTADPLIGESSLEVGPRRPFQPAPRQPAPPQQQQQQQYPAPRWPPPQPQQRQQRDWTPQPQTLLGDWLGYPGQSQQSQPTRPPPQASVYRSTSHPPPPRHPHSRSSVELTPEPVSDFAREFYAAGAGDASAQAESSSSASAASGSRSQYAPPPGAPPVPSKGYAPPPGSPPVARPRSSAEGAGVADDGRPTKTPTPGHPLLLNGKMLVYPAGYECHKCALPLFSLPSVPALTS